jgi:hypothetical protein
MGLRRPLAGRLAAAALLLGPLAAPAPGLAADPAVKACVADCNAARTACSETAAANAAAAQAACTGAPDVRECTARAKRIAKAGKKACKSARKSCKRCCRSPAPSCVAPPELPVASGEVVAPEREQLAALPLPPGPDGRGFTVIPLPDGVLFIDPEDRSPVSAAGECAEAVIACFAPPERNLAGCLASVPLCRGKPWKGDGPACCPAGCGERYQALRREGKGEAEAFGAALFAEPSCMPGLDGHEEPAP